MKQVFLSGAGQIAVFDVPLPGKLPGSVLVRNAYSLISTGTEGASVTRRSGLLGVYEKARASRDRVEQVWKMTKTLGYRKTMELVRDKLKDYTAVGYSCAGKVMEASDESIPLRPGERVACMGAGFASHAEYAAVPINLVKRIPDGVSHEEASFAALACIAMQGIRRLELPAGERIGVIGLGLIGQLCVRLLTAMGYEAFGIDLNAQRARDAGECSGVEAWSPDAVDSISKVMSATNNHGLDGIVVCAATKSDDPVNQAFDLCRQRGRVSIVGDVGLGLQREKMYSKEIELRLSCSYGVGRYDSKYELEGHDYPFGHVRWTEGRNLESFLSLLASGRLDISSLVSAKFPVDRATEAYSEVKAASADTYGILLDYDLPEEAPGPLEADARTVRLASPEKEVSAEVIRVGLIGVGGYAKAVHVPNLKKLANTFRIHGVSDIAGSAAGVVGKRTGAAIATSDHHALLADPEIDAVIIATRHSSHAQIALDALEAGKHVFIEKPMTTTVEDAQEVQAKAEANELVVRVGFNRRFSPYLNAMRRAVGTEGERVFFARVNIGQIGDDWSNTPEEGGRIMGEGVHFFDLCNWFIGSEPESLSATCTGDPGVTNPNACVIVRYPCGSAAQVLYTALGHTGMGKEYFEAFGNGRAVHSDDFRMAKGFGASASVGRGDRGNKGQLAELEEFAAAIRGEDYPVHGADARAGLVATWMAMVLTERRPEEGSREQDRWKSYYHHRSSCSIVSHRTISGRFTFLGYIFGAWSWKRNHIEY